MSRPRCSRADAAGDILTSSSKWMRPRQTEHNNRVFRRSGGPDPDAACPARVVKPSESDTSLPFHTEQMRYDVLRYPPGTYAPEDLQGLQVRILPRMSSLPSWHLRKVRVQGPHRDCGHYGDCIVYRMVRCGFLTGPRTAVVRDLCWQIRGKRFCRPAGFLPDKTVKNACPPLHFHRNKFDANEFASPP